MDRNHPRQDWQRQRSRSSPKDVRQNEIASNVFAFSGLRDSTIKRREANLRPHEIVWGAQARGVLRSAPRRTPLCSGGCLLANAFGMSAAIRIREAHYPPFRILCATFLTTSG